MKDDICCYLLTDRQTDRQKTIKMINIHIYSQRFETLSTPRGMAYLSAKNIKKRCVPLHFLFLSWVYSVVWPAWWGGICYCYSPIEGRWYFWIPHTEILDDACSWRETKTQDRGINVCEHVVYTHIHVWTWLVCVERSCSHYYGPIKTE